MTEVIILGAGNVATHLFRVFMANAAVQVKQVYNHNLEKLQAFDEVATTTKPEEILKADFYILALKDDVIQEVAKKISDNGTMVVHTSGAKHIQVLSKFSNYGVFYPLQTFSSHKPVDFGDIPLCLEANNRSNLNKLKSLAGLISENLYEINSEQRKALHVAAVFVNNFTNYMYSLGAEICEKNAVPFKILQPLIKETISKIEVLTPAEAQTGPARRNDQQTIHEHLTLLNEEQKKIYELLTLSIQKFHGTEL